MSDRCVKFYFSGSLIVYAYEEDTEFIQLQYVVDSQLVLYFFIKYNNTYKYLNLQSRQH